ncbi:hypothetical protein AU074_13925 [Pseudomonas sp. ATCC PTA-122608]|uniref:hypothetical protein n=1 Tax=Pseudomonas sp. ATCC PTA-122608 TaxID=1771311 RepID=UPI00096B740E|nr:hypothetical protein [Pseudomonas sp. ATCC PTA-122608]OLY72269.1 hypothetical protein AU074_13925 [Pseudomonas sp. ATCC PTA-122608]
MEYEYDEQKANTIAKFKKWVEQTKSIPKIYALLFFGAVAAPIGWLAWFYIIEIYIRRNPFLKNAMALPITIMTIESIWQGILLYVNIEMTASGTGSTAIIHVAYFCSIILMLIVTFIVSKVHFVLVKRINRNIRNYLLSNGDVKFGKTIKERARDKIQEVKDTLKEGAEVLK